MDRERLTSEGIRWLKKSIVYSLLATILFLFIAVIINIDYIIYQYVFIFYLILFWIPIIYLALFPLIYWGYGYKKRYERKYKVLGFWLGIACIVYPIWTCLFNNEMKDIKDKIDFDKNVYVVINRYNLNNSSCSMKVTFTVVNKLGTLNGKNGDILFRIAFSEYAKIEESLPDEAEIVNKTNNNSIVWSIETISDVTKWADFTVSWDCKYGKDYLDVEDAYVKNIDGGDGEIKLGDKNMYVLKGGVEWNMTEILAMQ